MPPTTMSTSATPQANLKARQLYVNNGTTTTPLPNSPNTNVVVSASTSSRPVKLEEMLSKDNFQGLLEIDNSDWLISEDHKLLDAIQNVQQLPLSSISFSSTSNANKPQTMLPNSSSCLLPSTTTLSSSPSSSIVNNTTNALTQNWDFISDIVNRYSRVLRTPKQCKHRFEQVIGPREEGRVVYDPIKKKKHVIKGTMKLSDDNWQTLRTNQLFLHDNCQKLFQIYHQKFETISQCDSQSSSTAYLNKFKQMQLAQATHHQMRGLKQGSLLHENNIHFDAPLTPSDVFYQRSEREKDLKQQTESNAANLPSQQTSLISTNVETIKQIPQPTTPTLTSTITPRVRSTPINTSATSVNPPLSTAMSITSTYLSSNPSSNQRSIPNNIIMTSNNHQNVNLPRPQSNISSSRANISSATTTTTSTNSNPTSLPAATILPGQRTVQILPPNHLSANEINPMQQKQMGTVQMPTHEYQHARPGPHQQQTITNSCSTPSNLQLRAQNYPRSQAPPPTLTTLEVRSQSPKSQPPVVRPLSTTSRTSPQVDYLNQPPTKLSTTLMNPSSLPAAVVRPLQYPSTSMNPCLPSSPTSPLNYPSVNVNVPSNKLNPTTTNPTPQIRASTTFVSNSTQSIPQTSQQPRQFITNTSNTPILTQQSANTQRLTDAAQRSTSNIQQILASRGTSLPGQVRNVRILTLTTGANPTAAIADATSSANNNTQQTSVQSTKIAYNRANSSTPSFARSTNNIDQDIPPELAAQLHRIKSFNAANADLNDNSQTPRAVLVPARTISSASPSSISATSKLKSSSSIDPNTVTLTPKLPQTNIVFQLPSNTTGTDEQPTTNSSTLTRQTLMQHLNIISSNINPRPQSPTTISNTQNSSVVNRFLQQYQQMRAAAQAAATASANNPSATATTTVLSGPATHDQSSSPKASAAPSSSPAT